MQKAAVRSRRTAGPAVAAPVGAPGSAPAWLKDDGLAIWARLAPTLSAAKLLSIADTETFARYCRNFARWLKMQAELDRDGETYLSQSKHGDLKRANPVFLISDRIERQLLATEDRFGLNPSARQSIMAARSQSGVSGDLFGDPKAQVREGDPAATPAQAAEPISSPIGMLQ